MAEADVNYINGKIYELVYGDKRYIGSTTGTLAKRYSEHKCEANDCKSRVLFEMASTDGRTVVINLIEDFPCESKAELEACERFHMEQCQDRVNDRIPGRSYAEWYQANRDRLLANMIKNYQTNRDVRLKQAQEYRDAADKGKVAEYNAKYKQTNKDRIREQQSVKVKCPCGVTHTHGTLARHERTQHHVNYMNRLKDTV